MLYFAAVFMLLQLVGRIETLGMINTSGISSVAVDIDCLMNIVRLSYELKHVDYLGSQQRASSNAMGLSA